MPERKRVLIVEDDPKSAKLGRYLFEYAGYEVTVVASGENILSVVKEKLPNLITLDYQLPGINGEQVLDILMADEKTKEIPIVFVTASLVDNAVKQKIHEHHCKVFYKPINTRTFVGEIEEVLYASGK